MFARSIRLLPLLLLAGLASAQERWDDALALIQRAYGVEGAQPDGWWRSQMAACLLKAGRAREALVECQAGAEA